MEKDANSRPGLATRWRIWREGRKRAARARRASAEERLDRKNQERYRAWGRGGASTGPDMGGGGGDGL
jgi:hypothetical protein